MLGRLDSDCQSTSPDRQRLPRELGGSYNVAGERSRRWAAALFLPIDLWFIRERVMMPRFLANWLATQEPPWHSPY